MCWTCEQQMRWRPNSLLHYWRRVSEAIFIIACSMDDHDEEKRTERNLFVRSGKYEVELELDISCYWSWQTWSITRPLRRQSYLWCNSGCLLILYDLMCGECTISLLAPPPVSIKLNKSQHFGPIYQLNVALICKWKHIWNVFEDCLCIHLWRIFWPHSFCREIKMQDKIDMVWGHPSTNAHIFALHYSNCCQMAPRVICL